MPFSSSWNDLHPIALSDPNKNRSANCRQVTCFAQLICVTLRLGQHGWSPVLKRFQNDFCFHWAHDCSIPARPPSRRPPGPANSQQEWEPPSCTRISWETPISVIPGTTEQTWNLVLYLFPRSEPRTTFRNQRSPKKQINVKGNSHLEDINLLIPFLQETRFPCVSPAHRAAHFRGIIRRPPPSSCILQESQCMW